MSAVEVVSPQQSPSRQLHKFGGSSLADPDCFRRVARILAQYSDATDIIVVSAAGKTTNRLIEWLSLLDKDGRLAHETLQSLRKYQQDLIENLIEGEQKQALVDALYTDFSAMAQVAENPLGVAQRAWAQGFGEAWSARLLSALLTQLDMPAVKLDSRSFLRAERAAQPEVDRASSWPLLKEQLVQHTHRRIVITGFMAQNADGETVLLGRNGSDYSATIIGALADVSRVTIWSDVAGVFSADPRLVGDACLLPLLRLDEAAELARLAAPVLHTRTLQPVAQSCIDLNLRCSYDPESGSTRVERVLASGRGAKIITSLDDVCLLQLDIPRSHDFSVARRDIERLLTRNQIQPLASSASADQHRIQLAYTAEVVNSVLEQLQDAGIPADIRLREGFSLVAAVGAGVTGNPVHCHGFYQQLRGQPIEFISESNSGLSIAALLRKTNTAALVADIHCALFQAQRRIGLVLLGKGNIGSRWLSLFKEQKSALEKRHGMNFELISVQDSHLQWVDFDGIDADTVMEHFNENAKTYEMGEWLVNLLNHPYDDIVVLDVTASAPLASQYSDLAEHGYHLISANKVAGSASSELYYQVQDAFAKTGRFWLYNATVGAGLPVNHTVRDLRESGDQIMALSGIFSGTLSWLFQQFNGEVKFSELLEQAWQQGLTEPDPREDLSGADVMRKLVILARESGLELEPEQVQVQSLVPDALAQQSLDGFLDGSALLDDTLEEWLEEAKKDNGVLRYVARLTRNGKARVGIEVLPEDHPLANLLPCDNIFAIESQWYRENPLVIRGPGAGRDVTAGALLSDLNRIASLLK
ncbi:bifunctional aspartate kinase/homoserine dehydrogenase II [Enterovibrio norvegicus FF-454]|uniref:Bifunctional aspartokinase/homoserine dehydrogenase n=1 Tax=Enterovibrio norvegicus FF-454 TaxID=1185651 RepID=A0A1E5CFZ2_9GAMM|nr:bifunctional aspartate kinase/homoserine dehydrogenase II [Enterovibrio norvegicus]OEE64436.1 bifunctional aspartate kinase/homoserine dehydrogenase II [Enterovibrio norvegicus FF-454]